MDNYFVEIAATRRGLFGATASVQTRSQTEPVDKRGRELCPQRLNKIQKRELKQEIRQIEINQA